MCCDVCLRYVLCTNSEHNYMGCVYQVMSMIAEWHNRLIYYILSMGVGEQIEQ